MGSGKSTVGSILATRLDYHFVDLDLFMEDKYKKSINQIFSENGEKYFRDIESESLTELSNLDSKFVVSTGGGVVLSPTNREVMSNSGTTIYLETGLDTVWNRIKDDKTRPLLNVKDPLGEAKMLLAGRIELYEKSDYTVNTDNLTAEKVADKVYNIIKNSGL